MTNCDQVCIYNFGEDGCLKPEWQPCRMSNTKPYRVTNADIIRFKSDEALAEFLSEFICCNFCQKYVEKGFDEHGICLCDGECKRPILDWLQRPVEHT